MTRESAMSNFTPRAQQALALARKEADRFNHNFLGTEHLLLGLVALGEGTAVAVLAKMGVKPELIRAEVERYVGAGPEDKRTGEVPYTPRVKTVLGLASKEAKRLNHPCVGTGHILLGLLREGEGVAARVLGNLDVDIERTRKEVLKELDPNYASSPTSSSEVSPIAKRAPRESESGPTPQNFTPRAQQVLALSREEAARLNHSSVGTEHLLLGLIALGGGVATNVLLKFGFNLETGRKEVEKRIGKGPEQNMTWPIPFAPQVKKVLDFARQETKSLNHTYIGTEHILLGILREDDGAAASVLRNLDVDLEKMREEILSEVTPTHASKSETTSTQPTAHSDKHGHNFTPNAQLALGLARKEADRFNHNFVGTEHLLMGLAKLEEGTAATVLKKMGINLESMRAEVEKQVGKGPDQKMIGNIPYTPRVKKVLALAAREAMALNHTYVGTEHILLGLLREGDGVGARVLKSLDVDIAMTRQEILKMFDPNKQVSPDYAPPSKPKGTPMSTEPHDTVDTTVRYDVYCREGNGTLVVYRNALFKNARSLFTRGNWDVVSDFLELEQGNGQTIFISRHSLARFCPHGVKMEGEEISGDKGKTA